MQNKKTIEAPVLTETASDEKIVISSETMPSGERIAERKAIVYETRIDPIVIKVTGEKFKEQLFTRFGFLKPKPDEVQLVSIDKYYEPFIVISGKYVIDYYRKCTYTVKVDKKVLEVILMNQKFEPNQPADSSAKDYKTIELEGEERLMNEVKASLILDRYGQEVPAQRLPSAASEKNPKKILAAFRTEEVAEDADLEIIRSRIVQRPKDINRLVNELFEVGERVVIYAPRFKVLYRNVKTGEEKTAEFDGVNAQRIQQSKHAGISILPPPPPPT
jgi:hypothetical protein